MDERVLRRFKNTLGDKGANILAYPVAYFDAESAVGGNFKTSPDFIKDGFFRSIYQDFTLPGNNFHFFSLLRVEMIAPWIN